MSSWAVQTFYVRRSDRDPEIVEDMTVNDCLRLLTHERYPCYVLEDGSWWTPVVDEDEKIYGYIRPTRVDPMMLVLHPHAAPDRVATIEVFDPGNLAHQVVRAEAQAGAIGTPTRKEPGSIEAGSGTSS